MHDVLNKLTNCLVSVVVLFVRALQFAVGIIRGITQSVPTLPCQDHSKRRTPVVALDHRLHLKKKILEKNLQQKYKALDTSLDCTTHPKLFLIFSKQFEMLSLLMPRLQSSIRMVRKPRS